MKVNFNTSDFRRQVADSSALVLKNRFFEQNPSLSEESSALIQRPGLKRLTYVGEGPIRGMMSEPGSFNGDLFIASGEGLWRMDNQLNKTSIFTGLANPTRGFVNMAITAVIGETPEFLFIADGSNLYVYAENGYAHNTLTGTPAANDNIVIDTYHYRFVSGSVDAGSPDGTLANPWLVAVGSAPQMAYTNLFNAINNTGVAGTDYSTALQEHPTVQAQGASATVTAVRSKQIGAPSNSIVTTETGAALEWTNGGTLVQGGEPSVAQVFMPEDVGVIDVAVTQSHVIVIPAQTEGFQGRFYWIEPGETIVDPLNFATAERSPDGVYGVQVFGDQFWLPGQSTTEVWFVTGDQAAPVRRMQGVVFDRGSWENTARTIHETLVVVDADGGVFLIKGGAPQRVSTPDIEEQIRKAMQRQEAFPL